MKSLEGLLTYDVILSNVEEILIQVNAEQYKKGLEWYHSALSFCKDLSDKVSLPLMNTTGVVAAMSPQKEWSQNKKIAELYFKGIYKHTKVQIDKCRKIENAKSFSEISHILGGLKTRNFFGNILYPEDEYFCTIDRHHIKICTGVYTDRITPYQYKQIKKIFSQVSRDFNMKPVQLQSILWGTYKDYKIKYFKQ